MSVREVRIGNKAVGARNPILIQSMCNTKTADVRSTVRQIRLLEKNGCDIIRVAITDQASAEALREIKKHISIPLVADIQFDYRLAILAARYADKIRINPGNIGLGRLGAIIDAAKTNSASIRIGVNMGSIDKEIEKKHGRTHIAMAESALKHLEFFEAHDFYQVVVSLKASDVMTTIKANRLFREKSDYPLHIGITEAGTETEGIIKSTAGIATLLAEGIGETIRVSLTENPIKEIFIAKSILKALALREGRIFVSCPTCARAPKNFIRIAKRIEKLTANIDKPVKIAVMGCEVNGPGEAKDATAGVAFSKKAAFIFHNGKIVEKLEIGAGIEEKIVHSILRLIR